MTNYDLKLSSYDYSLPKSLVAQHPTDIRDQSRLLIYDAKNDQITHSHFYNLDQYIGEASNMIFNDTKVFPSRLFGMKSSGGKAEMLILNPHPNVNGHFEVMLKTSGKKKVGDQFHFSGGAEVIIREVLGSSFSVEFVKMKLTDDYLEKNAVLPIPPYIRDGISDKLDQQRYQTIYAKSSGAVAAPTAGLHFSEKVFKKLEKKNISKSFVTLNVGPGTFLPVKEDDITKHKMHSEKFYINPNVVKTLNCKRNIAVGTTSLRVISSIYNQQNSQFESNNNDWQSTNIFLYPPHQIDYIDGLITNFHLPKSTLLMLVSCLIGRKKLLEIYDLAISEKYRFYSYGDSMLIKL